MTLTEAGESRVLGYLYVLERSLRLGLPHDVTCDAVQEIESHLRERIAGVTVFTDERAALEQILAELGPPLRVAQAYSAERTLDEAVVTGRLVPMVRAMAQLAATTVLGFLAALWLILGYVAGATLLVLGLLKPVFPDNIGFWVVNGPGSTPSSLGIKFSPIEAPAGGNWIILIGVVGGLGLLLLSHRGARAFLAWWRKRRSTTSYRT